LEPKKREEGKLWLKEIKGNASQYVTVIAKKKSRDERGIP